MKSLKALNPSPGQKVFVRADLDVTTKNGKVSDDFRLKKILPTIQYLLAKKAQIILAGHLGRPHGKPDPKLSLKPIANWLTGQGLNVEFFPQGETLPLQGLSLQICLLENLRFDIREEENDPQFAKELASLADIYVNEAFAASYEEHTSVVGIPKYLPSFVGLQFEKEVNTLSQVFKNPKRPLVFLVGGVKPEKAALIPDLAKIANTVLLAGRIAHLADWSNLSNAIIPKDNVDDLDIGPQTLKLFLSCSKQSKTIVWNGPLGKYEEQNYSKATKVIAGYLLKSNDQSLIIVGGGDTIAALHKFNLLKQLDQKPTCFISTGGGAMLEYLAQGTLPGIEALSPKV